MVHRIYIPRINDNFEDFIKLFEIWNIYKNSNNVVLDFSKCDFIRQNGVAFLGGLLYHIKSNGGKASILCNTLQQGIEMNLAQNGFLEAMGENYNSWDGNSIPYRHDLSQDSNSIQEYLEKKWIGKGWIHASNQLTQLIIGNVWELYENAFEHSRSTGGVFTCGQYFPYLNELILTVIDFGIGIPKSVENYQNNNPDIEIVNNSYLETAFQSGFSTVDKEARGLGLDLLKEFIQKNDGKMDIYSNNEHAIISSVENNFSRKNFNFTGTIINIKLKCDERYYHIIGESNEYPLF